MNTEFKDFIHFGLGFIAVLLVGFFVIALIGFPFLYVAAAQKARVINKLSEVRVSAWDVMWADPTVMVTSTNVVIQQ